MKLNDLQNTRWTLDHPELGTGPVNVESYNSPEFFELLREKVFKKTWICTGKRIDEIPGPGDYFLEDTDITGTSVIVVRGLDGKIRGFHNTCTHRGTQLLFESYGNVKGKLTCIYHGWAFSLTGKNLVVTEREMFFDLEKMEKDLTPVAVDVWAGFIFINLDPNPSQTLLEHIGPEVNDLFGEYPFDATTVQASYRAGLDCSWQVVRDSQLEAYHVKYLHNRTAPHFMESEDAPSRHAYDVKLLGKHSFGSWYGNRAKMSVDISAEAPVASLAAKSGQTLSSDANAVVDVQHWAKGVNPARTQDWFFDTLYLFPNYHIIFLGHQNYAAHKIMPGKQVGKSSWNARYFAPPVQDNGLVSQWAAEYMVNSLRDIWREDGNTTWGAHHSIASGTFKHMHLQDQEIMIRHAEKVVSDMCRS